MELGERPGEVKFIPFQSDIEKTRLRAFHESSLQTLSHFLEKTGGSKVKLVTVQPRSTFYDLKLTLEIDKAARLG